MSCSLIPKTDKYHKEKNLFVKHFAETGSVSHAAAKAGIPESTAGLWIDRPEMAAAIHLHIMAYLHRAAPKALNLLLNYVEDKSLHPKLRIDCAKTVLDRCGISANAKNPAQADTAQLGNMTKQQLIELLASLEGNAQPLELDIIELDANPLNFMD